MTHPSFGVCASIPIAVNYDSDGSRQIVHKRTQKAGALAVALRSRFALSGAETDIAPALAEGRGVAQISRARGVALHTVRSQLKAIFHKTGARSQAQLVAIVLRL